MRKEKRLILVAKFLPLTAIGVAIALVVVLVFRLGQVPGQKAQATSEGVNFSLTSTGCDSDVAATCNYSAGSQFTVAFNLSSLGSAVGYGGYDVVIGWGGSVNYIKGSLKQAGTGLWPSCANAVGESTNPGDNAHIDATRTAIPATGTPTEVVYSNGAIATACSTSGGTSTYTGTLMTMGFDCKSGSGTITLVQAATDLSSTGAGGTGTSVEKSADETLTVNCLVATNTPTLTPTLTKTSTKTSTPPPPPTITSTPTVSPTVTKTPTATPLPSDQPDVTITKTDSPDPVDAKATLTYSLLVKNLGLLTAHKVGVGDQLPAGVGFISANSSGATCLYNPDTNIVLCPLTDPLPQDGQVKIVILVTAPTFPKEQGDVRISNFAGVTAIDEPLINQGNNKDIEETVVLAPRADLTLMKTDRQDPVDSGGTIVYDLTAKNIGPQKATNVLIKENLPDGSTFLPGSSSPECTVPGGAPVSDTDIGSVDVQCDLGASFVGETTVHIAVTAPQEHRDTVIKNIAFVTGGNELFSQTGNNLAVQNTVVLAPPPDVVMDKAGPAKVRRTAYFSYTLTVSNPGFGDAFNLIVTDILPKHVINSITQPMTLQSTSGASCGTPVANQFSCAIPKLPGSGGQVVIMVNVRAPTTLTDVLLTNQASAPDPSEPGDPAGNNSDSQDTTIQACFDVTGDGKVRSGDITFVIRHYGAHTGQPLYDLLYDFDGNGVINSADITFVIRHYGQNCV